MGKATVQLISIVLALLAGSVVYEWAAKERWDFLWVENAVTRFFFQALLVLLIWLVLF